MRSFEILDIKHFMAKLLLSPAFDFFLLKEASITTFCTFSISSREKLSIRSDGSESPIFCSSVILSSPSVSSGSPEKSLVESDESDISS